MAKVQRKTAARALDFVAVSKADFEGEKALGDLVYRLRLLVNVSRHADNVSECSLKSGQQADGCAEIDDNHGFQKSEGRREYAADEQLPHGDGDATATPGEPGQRRNQNEKVYPPRLGNEADHHGMILL